MNEEYANELTKQSVARACAALGIKNIRVECIEALSDVIKHYIQSLALRTKENAELSGRAVAGIQDVIPALDHVSTISTKWHDLRAFAFSDEVVKDEDGEKMVKWNQPFPFDVPKFPIDSTVEGFDDSLNDIQPPSNSIHDPSIPSHLPAFPHAHTYKKASSSRKRGLNDDSFAAEKKAKTSTIKTARNSLAKLEASADEIHSNTKSHT